MNTKSNLTQSILVIAGPTASGKTAFAHQFAAEYGGEIVSADSRQVYRLMDIGTAKPTHLQQKEVRYHLLDLAEPDKVFTLGQFLHHANTAIQETRRRGMLPIVVGGTGQYIHALVNGWIPPEVTPNIPLRAELASLGVDDLQRRLREVDPISAQRIHPNNIRRVIRALEVYYTLDKPFSAFQTPVPSSDNFVNIHLLVDQPALNQRIEERINLMLTLGWKEEIEALLNLGYSPSDPGFSSLGYRTLTEVIQGNQTLETAIPSIHLQTQQLARRQKQWFSSRRLEITAKRVDDIDMKSLYNYLSGCTQATA